MRILVTNDDGIFAPGLAALAGALTDLGHQIMIVAPDTNQTGMGQAITVGGPITARRMVLSTTGTRFAVAGTPADCVRIAPALWTDPPDLVASGINHGANLGADVYRSGTVGAAREAVLAGLPALALSALAEIPPASVLRHHLPDLLQMAREFPGQMINVNFPVMATVSRLTVPVAWDGYVDEARCRIIDDGPTHEVMVQRSVSSRSHRVDDIRAALLGYVTVSRITVVPAPSRLRRNEDETAPSAWRQEA